MKIIGAGLPRTATLTQKIALEMLGFGPCYHMVNILSDLDLVPRWAEAFDTNVDWNAIFGDSQSTVDWPGSFFYRELVTAFPDAKVLLSVRDGASWARSMGNTIWDVFYGDSLQRYMSEARARVDPRWQNYIDLLTAMWRKSGLLGTLEGEFDADEMARAMEEHNEAVRQFVPKDRLLEWSPRDGWEPLCAFLEVPVPQAPLPHVNDSATFAGRIIDASLDAVTRWQEKQSAAAGS